MKKIVDINTVCQFNNIAGRKTLHPLVSVIDFSEINRELDAFQVGFYSIYFKESSHEYFDFGRKEYDYSDGTITFLTPGKTIEIGASDGKMLIFHPDILNGTCLGMHIDTYTFFNYNSNEALHISMREKRVFKQCMENINEELHRSIDKHSRELVTKSIDLLLSYCTRFYERQFITRGEINKRLIRKVAKLIDNYYIAQKVKSRGLLSAEYCSKLCHLSPAYFTDLLKYETGHSFDEYVQAKRISIAKKWLVSTDKPILEITYGLGYSSVVFFQNLFYKITGDTPEEFRMNKSLN